MIELVSGQKPRVEWIQVFPVIECKTEKVVCCGVVVDTKCPPSIFLLACTFDIDQLPMIADYIISRIAIRHPLNVFEYMTQNAFCDMNTEEQCAFPIFIEWAHSSLAIIPCPCRFCSVRIRFAPHTIVFVITAIADVIILLYTRWIPVLVSKLDSTLSAFLHRITPALAVSLYSGSSDMRHKPERASSLYNSISNYILCWGISIP